MNNPKHKLVPVEPTEEQWSGFARKVVMWLQMQVQNRLTPKSLLRHLELTGVEPPAWLMKEGEMETPDHAFSKGTIAAIIYRAMLEDAPASPTQPQTSLHELADRCNKRLESAVDFLRLQPKDCLGRGNTSDGMEWPLRDELIDSLCKVRNELTQALAAESELRGWQPIETAPKDGTTIRFRLTHEVRGYWSEEFGRWVAERTYVFDFVPRPKVWKPETLPEPPDESLAENKPSNLRPESYLSTCGGYKIEFRPYAPDAFNVVKAFPDSPDEGIDLGDVRLNRGKKEWEFTATRFGLNLQILGDVLVFMDSLTPPDPSLVRIKENDDE